jgi:tRNA pseudouridine55 synthase
MDGVLVVDKPAGLTSHDVVAVARRALDEPRIGHTGTLDPLATGVLPLACGRATRLVRFLTASDKDYDATIRFGLTTDTYDITGSETARSGRVPSREEVERGVASLRGTYQQMPPAYSAKKVGGRRAYDLARRDEPVALKAAAVTVSRAELLGFDGVTARVGISCSAGFYVRSFAHSLGEVTGAGACLEALRRTRSGEFSLEQAVPLRVLTEEPARAAASLVPLDRLLQAFPAVQLSEDGCRRVSHGQEVEAPPQDRSERSSEWVRLVDAGGRLVALATSGSHPYFLHPAVVLI